MKFAIVALCLLGLALTATAKKTRYDNYKVYRFVPNNEEQRQLLLSLQDQNPGVLFWKGVRNVGNPVDIMFPPHLQSELLESIQATGITTLDFIEDVQTLINKEEDDMAKAAQTGSTRLTWGTTYHTLAQIHQFLDEQAALNPGVASIESAGSSFEGRDLKVIKISRGSGKPAIWLDANIHAREWITNAVATYLINELLNSEDPEIRALSEDFDWYIMPVMNPDGYEYSRITDRMWRKTRGPTSSALCKGADPNRNWGFHWMEGGASNQPCTDTYGGLSAFSEVETEQSSRYITNLESQTDIVLYLSLHSYSQIILLPFGHNNNRYPEYEEYMRIARDTANAIARRYNTRFTYGNIVDELYVASGGSMDWVKGTHDTPITYTFEMRDTGRYGFLLPANQQEPSALEFIDGLKVIVSESAKVVRKQHPSILPIVNPGNKLPAIRPIVVSVGGPSLEVVSGPSILPIVNPGNKLPAIRPVVESVGGPSLEVVSGPSILPIVNPGNKLPAIRPIVEAVGGPSLEAVSGPSILPIVTPGNKLPAIRPMIEAVGGPSLATIASPSILPIVTPGNKLPVLRPQRPQIMPVVRPGNKLPGKPIIF